MAEDPEIEAQAGEYVLGTLSTDERAAFGARMLVDRTAAEAVRSWERALAPLLDTVAPEPPRAELWAAIERRLGGAAPANDRGVAAWRGAAIAASLVAAALGGWIATRPAVVPAPAPVVIAAAPAPRLAVANVVEGAARPGVLLTLDERTGRVVATPVGLVTPPGRSLQLWWIVGDAAPRPVGLIDAGAPVRLTLAPGTAVDGTTFAISVEPPGGSPTGQPTGPIPYTGQARLVPRI